MLCNIKPVPFHESDKHIFAKIPLDPPMRQAVLTYGIRSQVHFHGLHSTKMRAIGIVQVCSLTNFPYVNPLSAHISISLYHLHMTYMFMLYD